MLYSVQPRYIGKNISKYLVVNSGKKFLIMSKKSATDALKTSKGVIQKTTEATGNLVIKFLVKLEEFQKIDNKIVQRQLQMSMIKK